MKLQKRWFSSLKKSIPANWAFRHFLTDVTLFEEDYEKSIKNIDPDTHYTLFFDGASSRNPGPSGAGFCLYDKSTRKRAAGFSVHTKFSTNNQAEYYALLFGLKFAHHAKIKSLSVYGDSNLVVQQLKGKFRVRSKKIYGLYVESNKLQKKFDNFEITHLKRDLNKAADVLASKGVKKYFKIKDLLEELEMHKESETEE